MLSVGLDLCLYVYSNRYNVSNLSLIINIDLKKNRKLASYFLWEVQGTTTLKVECTCMT